VIGLAKALPGASIGVLVRTNKTVRRLLVILQRAGLQVSGEGGNPLDDDPAVEAVLAAITLADHPGDTIAQFQLRHTPLGPLFGLRPVEEASARAMRVDGTVLKASSDIRRALSLRGYGAVVGDWARQLAPWCSERSCRRLARLVEVAETFEQTPSLRPEDFVLYVRAQLVQETSPARIRVMTIHRSKGLEFDVVVMAGLTSTWIQPRTALLVDQPSATGPIQGVYRYVPKALHFIHPGLEAAYEQLNTRQLVDSLCGLYVGMTRARYALHMMIPSRELKRAARLNSAMVLREILLSGGAQASKVGAESDGPVEIILESEAAETRYRTLYEHGHADWAETVFGRRPGAAVAVAASSSSTEPQDVAPSASHSPTATGPRRIALKPGAGLRRGIRVIQPSGLEQGAVVRLADQLNDIGKQARQRGSLIHLFLQQIEWLTDSPIDPSGLESLARKQLPGEPEESYSGLVAEFFQQLEQPAVRAVLTPPAELEPACLEVWRERPFVIRLENELVRGVIDRAVVRWSGPPGDPQRRPIAVELVDFKSDAPQEAVETRAERYRPQLEVYRTALMRLTGVDPSRISCRLLFITRGAVVTL
jgi:ATP-dependent exoDNAse (exonuclease V) beta subunit